ncbi:RNA ligase family protein [Chondromyces crocatus]|uniref:DNA ligase n=1 Tax=Chondromyces crocatus TaxID=52 RepID=A0A0K1EEH1_CHOCO|nr:RNA ligase family protein [Chondromyces crocatus]AKT38978.1 DNA ligase [Chondromyces crocatus]
MTAHDEFFKFPSTPHIAWLAAGSPRADKVLDLDDAKAMLDGGVIVEEKVDGANLGISVDGSGGFCVQNRGTILGPGAHPQFQPLWGWLAAREERLRAALGTGLILFGEWCFAVHSIRYTRLPDWFLGFDVYDRTAGRFWSTRRRDALLEALGIEGVPRVGAGRFTMEGLVALLGSSGLTEGPLEGVYVRQEDEDWLLDRAKLVRGEFVQSIEEHWRTRKLEKNALAR